MADAETILEVRNVSKSYSGTRVLDAVSLPVAKNQIVGIVGENGAGKTTLFNIISGIVKPDEGEVLLNGTPIRPANYHEATLLGISRVFQEQALIPNIAVYENILLSHEGRYTRFGQLLDRRAMIEIAERVVGAIGLDIDVRRMTSDFDFSTRQTIEIARACVVPQEVLGIESPVVLLDEPTAALDRSAEQHFFDLVKRLREHGSVAFVSHRLGEVLAVSDVIYVLKDGKLVATVDPKTANETTLHGLMVGRERDADYYHEADQSAVASAPVVFQTNGLTRASQYDDVSLELHAGEVLGIGGLLHSGKGQFGRGAAGVEAPDRGTVVIGDSAPMRPDLERLMALGLGYIPAERHAEGMILPFSVAWNTSLASGRDIFSNRAGLWRNALETEVANRYIDELAIKTRGAGEPCATMSGGNQQKVVLAKWLCREPKVLVLDNPTRGVDAGAKEEIYRLVRQLTGRGVGIILITDELLELIGLSNRIVIMQHGQVMEVVEAPPDRKPSEHELVALMLESGGETLPLHEADGVRAMASGTRS